METTLTQPTNGYFITLEGSEGSGKTTALSFIKQWLTDHSLEFVITREPGGTALAEHIRTLLLNPTIPEPIDALTELLMMFAARNQHCKQVIIPALAQHKIVVSDRFTDTTWAYQGGGRQLNSNWIQQLETMVQGELQPNLTLLFDIPIQEGLNRATKRSDPDRFEREHLEFFERIRQGYLQRAKLFKDRYRVMDAKQPVLEINQQLHHYLTEQLTP